VTIRNYKTDPATRLLAKIRRDELREAGLCINGPKHGEAVRGVRCQVCAEKHGGYA